MRNPFKQKGDHMKRVLLLAILFVANLASAATVEVGDVGGSKANATHNGFLSSGDWTTFNSASGGGVTSGRLINTTAPLTGGGDLSADRTLAIPAGTSSANGYLASGDWTIFNNKAAKGANADITSMTAITSTTGQLNAAGLTVNGQTNNQTDALGIVAKGANVNDSGFMLWNTSGGGVKWTVRANTNGNFEFIDTSAGQLDAVFTQSTGRMGIGSASPGSKLTVNGDIESKSTGFKFPNGTTIAGAATTSLNGYLTSTDWTAFNNKQTTTLTHFNALAGNSSNVAEAFDSTLLGDVKADAKHQVVTMALGSGIGGFQPVIVTATAHGRIDGEKMYFTTTGALYQPLVVSTTYYAYVQDANTIRVCATYQEAIDHDNCVYSQTSLPPTQSGTHTLWMGGLRLASISAIPPANSLALLGPTHGKVLTLTYDDSQVGNQDMRFNLPSTFPGIGQFLQVDTTSSPSLSFKWGTPASASWALGPVVCVAIGVNFFTDDFSANGGSCNANFGGVAYGYGTGSPPGNFAQGDRILFVNTTNEADFRDDGIYYADNGGSVIRATDADTAAKLNAGTVVEFNDALGSALNHSLWTQTANITTIDTTPQLWQRVQTVPAASAPTASGACSVSSTTVSTTPSNLTCSGVPASTAVAVNCSGGAAFSTAAADALYCRATGTANQIACNTAVANITAMTFACSWVRP